MTGKTSWKSKRKNQRGFLSVDFLFAMTMAAVLCMMMFAFATTLSMLEVAQYIAFSTTRAHAAGHLDQARQAELGKAKFESFSNARVFPSLAPLLGNGWFEMDPKSLEIRGGGQGTSTSSSSTFNDIYGTSNNTVSQIGIRFRFYAKILKMNLPFMGAITNNDDFGTYVTGLMIREPTSRECTEALSERVRFDALKNLDTLGRFRALYSTEISNVNNRAYMGMEDNGC